MSKILIICGPTATGKTDLAVHLAKKFSGEIISADSRQVYKDLDIGTGKDIDESSKLKAQSSKLRIKSDRISVGFRMKDEIPIWLVDIVAPDYIFNVSDFQKLAVKVIDHIWSKGKLPIVTGGTGLYIKSILEPMPFISIPPDKNLRDKLSRLERRELAQMLKNIDTKRWKKMNHSDRLNPRRLIRAIELSQSSYLHFNTKQYLSEKHKYKNKHDYLLIGLKADYKILYERIDRRVEKRIQQGVVDEVKKLLKDGYSFDLPSFTASGYRLWQNYFKNKKMSPTERKKEMQELIEKWKYQEHGLARKQLTYFNKLISQHHGIWFDIESEGYKDKIEETVNKWYTFSKR